MANEKLKQAKQEKKYEFYTQLTDIEKELKYYKNEFKGKTIFCNCDDPEWSNFWKYFELNFDHLGIKKLISTHYEDNKPSYKLEIIGDITGDGKVDHKDIIKTPLKQNGDFRSPEAIEILKEADIVITNPPFGLFREYISQLDEYGKDFIIIGNTNALTYREVFKLFKEDKIRTGYTNFNVGMFFFVPDSYEKYTKIVDGKKMARVSTSCWFTSLPVKKHNDLLICYKNYNPEEYPKFENYDAINVSTYTDIPMDYDGVMGVPVTFLDKYNPEQFEIIGLGISNSGIEAGVQPYKPEHKEYRKKVQKRGAVDGDLYMMIDGVVTVPYARILIKKR